MKIEKRLGRKLELEAKPDLAPKVKLTRPDAMKQIPGLSDVKDQ